MVSYFFFSFFWKGFGCLLITLYIFFLFLSSVYKLTLPSIMGRGVGLRGLVGFLHFPRSFFIFSFLWRTIPRN